MTLTARKGSTILSPQMQVSAYYQYDFATRKAVRVVETIVPTINSAEAAEGMYYAADRFYFPIGAIASAASAPPAVDSISGTLQSWDATQKMQYARFRSGGVAPSVLVYFIYPTGVYGAASNFTPKNADVTKCIMQFTAKFGDNSDYGTQGLGFLNGSSGAAGFGTATDHFIQVLRNTSNWELGTCDGTTISQSASSGGGDGSWHEFRVEWEAASIGLYVDDTLVITKTTNLPTKPLRININGGASLGIDVADLLIRWD